MRRIDNTGEEAARVILWAPTENTVSDWFSSSKNSMYPNLEEWKYSSYARAYLPSKYVLINSAEGLILAADPFLRWHNDICKKLLGEDKDFAVIAGGRISICPKGRESIEDMDDQINALGNNLEAWKRDTPCFEKMIPIISLWGSSHRFNVNCSSPILKSVISNYVYRTMPNETEIQIYNE